ncbi:MAG: LamG-like jellyroll fold domain-containing protein, partial [Planctomycetota bacterium]
GLDVGGTYYWRIDPSGGADLTGHIWSFTIGPFLIVDDMESYDTSVNYIHNIWVDGFGSSSNDSEVSLIYNDPNYMRAPDSNSMKLRYRSINTSGGKHVGSWVDANPANLEIGTDWTLGGVKSLDLYFRGDPCNITAASQAGLQYGKLWLELEDTGANNILSSEEYEVWQVDLNDFNSASVDLSSLAAVRIGVAGDRTEQPGPKDVEGYVYIDDIRLYPPRCRTDLSVLTGDFTEDCIVDSYDLDIMATDWLLTDGNSPTGNRPATLTGFPDETSHWVTGYIGTGAIEVNDGYNIDVDDPRLNGLTAMSMTCWISTTISTRDYVSMVSSREEVGCGDDASELGVYQDEVGYDWSCGSEEWQWSSGLTVPTDGTWTFIAIAVDPYEVNAYMKTASGALQTSSDLQTHELQQNFSQGFTIGNNDKSERDYFVGKIDDVRIYTYALDFNDVNNLLYGPADPNPWPVYHYEFDETTGYTAADTCTPTIVYGAVSSVANLTDPEPKLERAVNFRDYAILADIWLEENLWP